MSDSFAARNAANSLNLLEILLIVDPEKVSNNSCSGTHGPAV
ncbi:MAG: hypothetical protein ABL861_06010 [Nitrosomonas sp.]